MTTTTTETQTTETETETPTREQALASARACRAWRRLLTAHRRHPAADEFFDAKCRQRVSALEKNYELHQAAYYKAMGV